MNSRGMSTSPSLKLWQRTNTLEPGDTALNLNHPGSWQPVSGDGAARAEPGCSEFWRRELTFLITPLMESLQVQRLPGKEPRQETDGRALNREGQDGEMPLDNH